MRKLLRLVYVSHALFEVAPNSPHIEPELSDILAKARKNNQRDSISGALYFANGYFFQCLEGKEAAVYALLDKIKLDPRHERLKISYCKRVRRRRFKTWSMKYVPTCREVDDLIASLGYSAFKPIDFIESDINTVVDLFTRLEDSSLADSRLREYHRLNVAWWQRIVSKLGRRFVA